MAVSSELLQEGLIAVYDHDSDGDDEDEALSAPSDQPGGGDLQFALELEVPPIYYHKADFIVTATKNKVSKRCVLCGSTNISLAGKSIVMPGVILRGDLQMLRIGHYVCISEDCVVRPAYKSYKGKLAFFPLHIGSYVTIGARTVVSAAQVGTCVDIGEDCVISKRCIIKENSKILPGTVLPPDTVVPPFTVFGGSPGVHVADLPESAQAMQMKNATMCYRRFKQRPEPPRERGARADAAR
mmetsp:Transcript_10369/g.23421  ORF Transcript_10369/g.23421 Transcript_10369/m.23421 type:complete len:241 (+) Transcript_10369:87-809(+)